MPSKRSGDVKQVAFWLNHKLVSDFKERCKADNLTMTEAIVKLIEYYISH